MPYNMIMGWVGWYYVPRLVTQQAVQLLHTFLFPMFHITPPKPGTQAYQTHFRITYAVVVLGYLLYNMISSSLAMEPNFYQHLGVAPDVDDNGLKVAFRQFAKKNHPDRPGIGKDGADLFIAMRDIFEALKNPVVRFAYDRFGEDVVKWKGLTTPREYLMTGLMRSSGYHAVSIAVLFLYSSMGRPSPVKYWRYLLFVTLLSLELSYVLHISPTLTSANQRSILNVLLPQRVAYQHVLFLHQLFLFISTGLTIVAPQLFPDNPLSEVEGLLASLGALAGVADRELTNVLNTELHSMHPPPCASPSCTCKQRHHVNIANMRPVESPSPEVLEILRQEIENMIIEKNLMQESGPLRSVWENAIEKGWEKLRRKAYVWEQQNKADGKMKQVDGLLTPNGSSFSPISPPGTPPSYQDEDEQPQSSRRSPSPYSRYSSQQSNSPSRTLSPGFVGSGTGSMRARSDSC